MPTNHSELDLAQHGLYQPKFERYLTRLVGEREAEDLTQEVLLEVNQTLEVFRAEASLSTWVYRIATNAAIDRRRTASYRQAAHTRSLDESTSRSATDRRSSVPTRAGSAGRRH
ncbi:MAG: hypothetical protein M1570_04245 [Chloroflexi bacterium]|nr:hypothetical protein [Chloroflexota bacterium]